jgi:hypothetical protein
MKLFSHCCFAGLSCVLVSCRGTVALFETGAAASIAAFDERRRKIIAAAVSAVPPQILIRAALLVD